jgi:hypothetical protein
MVVVHSLVEACCLRWAVHRGQNLEFIVAGQNNYPKTVGRECRADNVVTLHERQGSSYFTMTDEDKGQTARKSFMQKHKKNVTCYKCGKKGHY